MNIFIKKIVVKMISEFSVKIKMIILIIMAIKVKFLNLDNNLKLKEH